MPDNAIRIVGLKELERAFGRADKELRADLKGALEEAAAPVRADAQALAPLVPKVEPGDPWSRMRVGSGRSAVWVAPVERGTRNPKKRRPKFKYPLLGRALEPALSRNREKVIDRIDQMLSEVAKVWSRG